MKRALVTGGSGAIGAAICRRLAADGLHVIVHANRHLASAQSLCDELTGNGGSAQAIQFDVTDGSSTQTAPEALLEGGPVQGPGDNTRHH